jgi:tetratricopeptide (TPR) repeat protein
LKPNFKILLKSIKGKIQGENSMKKKQQKIDLVQYWRWFTVGYMMLAWIILKHFMRLSEWTLIPALIVYLLISAVICRHYVTGMIGNYFYFIRKPDKAMEYYTKAVKHNTRNVKALYNYALDSMHNGKADEALPILQRAERINTKPLFEKLIPLAISSCYWIMGDIDKAIEILENLCREFKYVNPSTLTTLGYFYLLKGDCERAEKITKKALKDNPEYAPAWDNLGQIKYTLGELDDAEKYFVKALNYRENMPESLYYMGKIEAQKGNTEKAKDYLKKADGLYISSMSTITKEMITEELAKLGVKPNDGNN